jgi:carboxypeptidase C (cathepsin A)
MSQLHSRASLAAVCVFTFSAALAAPAPAPAADTPDKKQDTDTEKPDGAKFQPFKPEAKTSTGTVTISGQAISYQAIAGTLIVHPKDWDDVARDPKPEKES